MSMQNHPNRHEGLAEVNGQIKARAFPEDPLFPELPPQAKGADPMLLWGGWPGDEPIEELMAMLD
jgi:hypothetical protein